MTLLLWWLLAPPAHAQEPEELPESGEDETLPEASVPDTDDEDFDPELDADEAARTAYTAQQEAVRGLAADEQARAWEQFLEDHPDTPFRTRVEWHIDQLLDAIHDESIAPADAVVEAPDTHVRLSPTLVLENIEPRTRVFGGFEWGLPDHYSLNLGGEVAPLRQLSFNAQVRRRFITGWSVEGGVHVSPVVSRDLGLVVTVLADVRLNTAPVSYAALRPQLGVGKRVTERWEAQVLLGGDGELREAGGVTWLAGAHTAYHISQGADLFTELTSLTKHPSWPGGALNYTNVAVGIRFLMGPRRHRDAADAFVGTWLNLYRYYWDHGRGAVVVRADGYLDDLVP